MKTFTPALAAIVLTAALSGVALAGPSFGPKTTGPYEHGVVDSTAQTTHVYAQAQQPVTRGLELTERPLPAAAPASQAMARADHRYTAVQPQTTAPQVQPRQVYTVQQVQRRPTGRPRYVHPADYFASRAKIVRPAFRMVRLGRL